MILVYRIVINLAIKKLHPQSQNSRDKGVICYNSFFIKIFIVLKLLLGIVRSFFSDSYIMRMALF